MNPTLYMHTNHGLIELCEIDPRDFPLEAIKIIAKVLKDNKHKYEPGNWKTLTIDTHLEHAWDHIDNWRFGSQEKEDLPHALIRLAMAAELEAKK